MRLASMITVALLNAVSSAQVPDVARQRATDGTARREIDAARWFNNPPYRLHDDRRVLLLFFECADRESLRWARQLARLADRKDWLLIALTEDKPTTAERFIERHRIPFTVGAGSRSRRTFDVDSLPAVLLVDRDSGEQPMALDLDAVWDVVGETGASAAGEEVARLQAQVAGDADGWSRCGAVRELWESWGRSDPQAFTEYALGRAAQESNPWVRGKLNYYTAVARGELADVPYRFSPSTEAFHRRRADPNAPEWAPYRSYVEQLSAGQKKSVAELLTDYASHLSDEDNDLLIRNKIVGELGTRTGESERAAAREALMQVLVVDPDSSIRLFATGGLGEVCTVGDVEAVELLERLAEIEPHLENTKAAMEYIAAYLRTGSGEADPDRPPAHNPP